MLELAFKGSRRYWGWVALLGGVLVIGGGCYLKQLSTGLVITGLSRDVPWGFYLSQLTFLVGVAASAVMVVLPCYLHDFRMFGRITVFGEFVAIAAVLMCTLFLFVDLGQPMRALNVFLYPTPGSIIFWDATVLTGYLLLNLLVGWNVLEAERNGVPPQPWIKPLIYLSIPWAFAIHTVTAFLYCGLPGRGFWLTAVLAPRFLASAFSSGPALLILLCLLLRRLRQFDAGTPAIQTLSKIVVYCTAINLFFLACELFVAFYSQIPEHMDHFVYLYAGLEGKGALVPWMRTSLALLVAAFFMLLAPGWRRNETLLALACIFIFIGTWIDKGLGLVTGGFVPSPLHQVTEYIPTAVELAVSAGIYALGLLLLTLLFNIAVTVKRETRQEG